MPWSFAFSAPDERRDAEAGDRGRVLEREEHPEAGPLVGAQLEDVAALPVDLAAGDDVRRVAEEGVGERRLARAVGAHDRVDLALADLEVDPLEDLGGRARDGATRRPRMTRCCRSWLVSEVTMRSVLLGGRVGATARSGTRSARVIESRVEVIASRTRTHRMLTVQRDERSQTIACSGSSDAQIIGAIGPSRARSTSLIRISRGGADSS